MLSFLFAREASNAALARNRAHRRLEQRAAESADARRDAGPPPRLPRQVADWPSELSESSRPRHLVRLYPHLANRLALCWPDPKLRSRVLEELLAEPRGGCQAFPAHVWEEIIRLRIAYGESR